MITIGATLVDTDPYSAYVRVQVRLEGNPGVRVWNLRGRSGAILAYVEGGCSSPIDRLVEAVPRAEIPATVWAQDCEGQVFTGRADSPGGASRFQPRRLCPQGSRTGAGYIPPPDSAPCEATLVAANEQIRAADELCARMAHLDRLAWGAIAGMAIATLALVILLGFSAATSTPFGTIIYLVVLAATAAVFAYFTAMYHRYTAECEATRTHRNALAVEFQRTAGSVHDLCCADVPVPVFPSC